MHAMRWSTYARAQTLNPRTVIPSPLVCPPPQPQPTRIVWSDHARRQCRERKLSVHWIESALASEAPLFDVITHEDGSGVRVLDIRRVMRGRGVYRVVMTTAVPPVIITAYYTSKRTSKYDR